MKDKFLKQIRGYGRQEEGARYYQGHMANRWQHGAALDLARLYEEITGDEIIDEFEDAFAKGIQDCKKQIRDDRKKNDQRLARMQAERELKTQGFGQ